jgi:hypothetical protein
MSDDRAVSEDDAPGTAAPQATRDAASDAALARYAKRMRPLRIWYAAGIVALIVIAAVLVKIAYSRGEVSHASLHTVPTGLPSISVQPPSPTLSKTWSSTDATAIGSPLSDGTIITYDEHTVRGRNARTGAQTWSYTRTDRQVCTAMQDGAQTVAVYQLHGNCDELTALDSNTGARKWTRTLDKDTAEFDGPATFQVRPSSYFFASHTSVYAVSPNGVDWWSFHHVGCTINSAVLGSSGALISQTCHNQDCGDKKFCGNGPQLLLREATAGFDDNTYPRNPDRITWNLIGSRLVPVDAGQNIAARDANGTLHLLSPAKGDQAGTIRLSGPAEPFAVNEATDADLVWVGGRTYALRTGATKPAWVAATGSVPTTSDAGGPATTLDAARLAVPVADGLAQLDPATGRADRRFPVGTQPRGSLVYPLGRGFLVAGPHTTVYS